MRYILSEIKAILSKNRIKKNELQEISYLLRAFHNLPRAFFSCSSNLYLSYNDALKNANDEEVLKRVYVQDEEEFENEILLEILEYGLLKEIRY